MDHADEYRRVAVLDNDVEAALLGSQLDRLGVPHLIQSYHDSAYDGIFQMQRGWGCVTAPASCHEQVLAVLSELRQASEDEDLSPLP